MGRLPVARDVPDNVRRLHNSASQQCNPLATGFYSQEGDSGLFSYCADKPTSVLSGNSTPSVLYIAGPSSLTNLDIDCDGVSGGPRDNGQCSRQSSPDYQNTTAFIDILSSYQKGILDLSPYVHPYVVFGNTGPDGSFDRKKNGFWPTFDPTQYGVQPLSIVAVVCGNKMVYGLWGDVNGADGDYPLVGEGSYALGKACFPDENITGNNGHDANDVLYLAFPGQDAVLGANGANWSAQSYDDFEKSIQAQGDRLVARISAASGSLAFAGWWVVVLVVLSWAVLL